MKNLMHSIDSDEYKTLKPQPSSVIITGPKLTHHFSQCNYMYHMYYVLIYL